MKRQILYKIEALLIVMVMFMAACSDDINVPVTDEKAYENAIKQYGFLRHQYVSDISVDVDLRNATINRNICLGVTKPNAEGMKVQVEVATDSVLIANYNLAHNTNYKAFPANQVKLGNNGELTVGAWQTESDPLTVTITKNTALTPDGTNWILPIKVKGDTSNILAGDKVLWFQISVNKLVQRKHRDVVNIVCVQINGVNPLNVGLYKLKDSGEPFFDQVAIFAANINWDAQKKRAYITFNENMTPLLAQRNKYIKPLQDMGIKVTLSLLGNRDGVCFRNYDTAGAMDFAREIKSVVDAYGLDGIMFDEEYMGYGANGLPQPNNTSWIRLCYELKKIMPDKLLTLYTYGIKDDFTGTVSGVPAGELIDYAFRYGTDEYNNGVNEQKKSFNQLDARKYGPMSLMLNDDYLQSNYGGVRPSLATLKSSRITQIETIRDTYGCNFFYNLQGFCENSKNQENLRQSLGAEGLDPITNAVDYSKYFSVYSTILYGEEVYRDGFPFTKDY